MNSKLWKWFLPGHLACLPFTLGYAIWCWFAYEARSWGVRNGVLVCIATDNKLSKMFPETGAQTIGACQSYDDSRQINRADLHVHENVHIVEAFICAAIGYVAGGVAVALGAPLAWLFIGGTLGALAYSLLYIGVFARWYFTDQGAEEKPGWHDDYMRNFLEKLAYAAQERFKMMTIEQRMKVWQ